MTKPDHSLPFYLKYRPQHLNDLVGQEQVKKNLISAFENSKLSHAYLFVGPRGTGKTSTARILAKMVNCEDKSEVPCNKCATCLSITDGSNLDLIEIDAASNRGIEDIRQLKERIKLSPTSARKKVYIIDEVHMLTQEAFNALLKTLEEPPSHALFILATTDMTKIPATIISRVQRLDFKLASPGELRNALTKIIREEAIEIDNEALNLLVKKADGSFRDGIKLLDQISSSGNKISPKIIEEIFISANFDDLLDLTGYIATAATADALLLISKQNETGVAFKQVNFYLMENFLNLMLIKNGLGQSLVEPLFLEEKYGQLIELSEKFDNGKLIKVLEILQKAYEQLKFASIPQLPLELVVVEICGLGSAHTTVIARNEVTKQSDSSKTVEDRELKIEPSSTIHHPPSNSDSSDIAKLKEKWTFVLETVRPHNFSLEALLRSIKINDCTLAEVIMEVPYSFHQRIIDAPKNREILESILSVISSLHQKNGIKNFSTYKRRGSQTKIWTGDDSF